MNCKDGRKRGKERKMKSGIIHGIIRKKIIGAGVISFFLFGVQVSGNGQVNELTYSLA